MSPDGNMETILQLQFMSSLSDIVQKTTCAVFEEVSSTGRIEKDTVLFTEGSVEPDVGYILLDGELTIQKTTSPEIQVFAPELIGEMKQFNPHGRRTATVIAATNIEAMRFAWSKFYDLLEQRLNESDLESVRHALEECAWQHFTD